MSQYEDGGLDSQNEPKHVNQRCILRPGAAILLADYLILKYIVQLTDKSSINIAHFQQSWFPFQCDGEGVCGRSTLLNYTQRNWSGRLRRGAGQRLAFIQLNLMRRNMELLLDGHKIACYSDSFCVFILSFILSSALLSASETRSLKLREHTLTMFKNSVLMRIFGLKREQVRENDENCTLRSFKFW